jgi:hypothetical protein
LFLVEPSLTARINSSTLAGWLAEAGRLAGAQVLALHATTKKD